MNNWKNKLYIAGYLLTSDKTIINCKVGVDWSVWGKKRVNDVYDIYWHPEQTVYLKTYGNKQFLLVGHCYNPFTMDWEEPKILDKLAEKFHTEGHREYLNQLTGSFFYAVIEEKKLILNTDCTGILPAYYAWINERFYCSAYSQMIADICDLQEDEYVTNLKKSRTFHYYGWFLPSDLSPYKEVRRIIANTEVFFEEKFECKRFYPNRLYDTVSEDDYEKRVHEIGKILYNSMSLILKKWEHPAISLTGGIDSQTTLACAKDRQKDFSYYSYVSLEREETDARAARYICEKKGLNHKTIYIENEKISQAEVEQVDDLIYRHYSFLGRGNENDVYKRIVLSNEFEYDIEVKSWVSEVARASRYKIYGKSKMPKITARRLTSMYKVFLFNRRSAKRTDQKFEEYLERTHLTEKLEAYHYPWSEFFVWEIVFGCWGSLALTGEHRLSNDITIPYNNRALLDLMLRTPLEKRLTDSVNKDIIRFMDKELSQLNVHIVNGNETKLRQQAERLYFEFHSRLFI